MEVSPRAVKRCPEAAKPDGAHSELARAVSQIDLPKGAGQTALLASAGLKELFQVWTLNGAKCEGRSQGSKPRPG